MNTEQTNNAPLYTAEFHRITKDLLPAWQYEHIRKAAMSAAGGAQPALPGLAPSAGGPTRQQTHIDVPLGSTPRKRVKRRVRQAAPPAAPVAKVRKDRNAAVADIIRAALGPEAAAEAVAKEKPDAPEALAQAALNDTGTVSMAISKHCLRKPRPLTGRQSQYARVMKTLRKGERPIIDYSRRKQVVYCVALEPDSVDAHGDTISAEEIEKAAHRFMVESRAIYQMHKSRILAEPVESFIAPQGLRFGEGMYGPTEVRKGSWVLGIRIRDKQQWQRVVDGQYTGISVGGIGMRDVVR